MTSIELKHQTRLQEWASVIKDCRNEAERSATLYLGNVRMDIYPSCGREQLKILVEMLHIC